MLFTTYQITSEYIYNVYFELPRLTFFLSIIMYETTWLNKLWKNSIVQWLNIKLLRL